MPRTQGFSEPEPEPEHSAEYSASLPSDPDRRRGRAHEISVRSSGSCLCLPSFLRPTFVPASLESLYQTYFRRQRHETLLVLVVFAALFACYVVALCAALFAADRLAPLAVAGVGLLLDIVLFALCRKGLLPSRVARKVVPYLLWLLITAQVFSYLGLGFPGAHAASDTVGWQAFFVFSFFITLPLGLGPIVVISVVSCVAHTLVLGVTVAQQQQDRLKGMQLLREVSLALPPGGPYFKGGGRHCSLWPVVKMCPGRHPPTPLPFSQPPVQGGPPLSQLLALHQSWARGTGGRQDIGPQGHAATRAQPTWVAGRPAQAWS